jgi:hypothetical protein
MDKQTNQLVETIVNIERKLLDELKSKQQYYSEQIKNADLKKITLVKKLKMYENDLDKSIQNEIIKELEEYSRIRRHCSAQLSRIQKVIGNVALIQMDKNN